MCELLGLSFSQSVGCALSFGGFRRRGEDNPHGWGMARLIGKACQVFKEPIEASSSRLAGFSGFPRAFTPAVKNPLDLGGDSGDKKAGSSVRHDDLEAALRVPHLVNRVAVPISMTHVGLGIDRRRRLNPSTASPSGERG